MTYNELVTAVQDYCENNFPTADMNIMIRQAEQTIYNTVQIANLRKNVTGTLTPNDKYLSAPNDFLSTYSLAVIDTSGNYKFLINKDVNFIREAYPNPTDTGLPQYYAIFGPSSTDVRDLTFILGPTPNTNYGVELHFYYYPESIVQAALSTVTILDGGAGYVNGSYFGVPLTGGSGSTATANIVVSSNAVTSVTLVNPGCYYAVGDSLSASETNLGGSGTGLVLTVTQVTNPTGATWLGDNFDSALFNATMIEAITYMKGEKDMVDLYTTRYAQSVALLKNLGDGKQRMDAYRDGQVRNPVK